MRHCEEPLGIDGLLAGNPLGKSSDTQQGSFVRGNVECTDGFVLFAVDDCDVTDDGIVRGEGKNMAWKAHLHEV